MTVRVQMRPLELASGPTESVDFPQAASYFIHEDSTLELLNEDGDVIGHVHCGRWDVVRMVNEAAAS